MKHSVELAYLRQLCCLGLPKETFIPAFLQAITTVIPSQNNNFAGVDPKVFKPGDLSMSADQLGMANTIQQVMNDYWIPERTSRVARWFQKHSVMTDLTVFDENYHKSILFNMVMKPFDQYHPLLVFLTDQGNPVGAINLFRPRAQKPFNANEQVLLLQLLPYVNHALKNQAPHEMQYAGAGETGLLLLDREGTLLYQNATAERLLLLASYPMVALDTPLRKNLMLPKLAQLCRNLDSLFAGHDAPPPSFCHTNGCGRFVFKAYWLEKTNREPGGLIGVSIEHQEPLALKLLRALKSLPLSPVQKEVALLVAQGVSTDKIGAQLHIKYTTVKDHIRKIFDKLDIHHRDELLPRLLAGEKERLIQLH